MLVANLTSPLPGDHESSSGGEAKVEDIGVRDGDLVLMSCGVDNNNTGKLRKIQTVRLPRRGSICKAISLTIILQSPGFARIDLKVSLGRCWNRKGLDKLERFDRSDW